MLFSGQSRVRSLARRALLFTTALTQAIAATAAAQEPAAAQAPAVDPIADFNDRFDETPEADLNRLLHELDALAVDHPKDPRVYAFRRWTHDRILRRSLPMFDGRLEQRLALALTEQTPEVDYTALAVHLEAIVVDLGNEYLYDTIKNQSLRTLRNTRAIQARRARDFADPPIALPPVTRRPPPPVVRQTGPDRPPLVTSTKPQPPQKPNRVSLGLGVSFLLAGAGTVVGSCALMSNSVMTEKTSKPGEDLDFAQHIQAPIFTAGAVLAVGGGALLGGGSGLLVADAVARDPAKRRPIHQASWVFLVSAGAFTAAAAYMATEAHQQWADVADRIKTPEDPLAYDDSNAGFNRAAVLGAVAASQLGLFIGTRAGSRDRDPPARSNYSVRPILPAVGVSRSGASVTLGFKF
jgi:hypothetical protein